jgi:hypothetical protein
LKRIVLFFLLSVLPAVAQFTTVTGTVIDPHGVPYALGTITPLLVVPSGAGSPTLNGQPYSPPTSAVGLDKNGTFSFNIADNAILLPASTKWNFTVCSGAGTVEPAIGTGPQCFSSGPITITGGSQSLSATLSALAPSLTVPINGGGGGAALPAGVAPGSALVSNGVGALVAPVYQAKAIYDVRDWATCDGVADSSVTGPQGGVKALVIAIGAQEATIRWIGSTTPSAHCRLENIFFPANISHDFSGGGAIEMISSTTPVGGAVFVNGTSAECNGGGGGLLCNTANATAGSTTLALTAGNTAVVSVQPYPGFSFKISTVTDTCGDLFYHVQQSLANQPRNVGVWVASNIAGGTCTITANANGATTHIQVLVNQFSGMGPVVSADGKGSCNNADATTMDSLAGPNTAGSLLFAYGGQPFTAETCTAGAGFTQPAGLAGQSTNGFACAEYQLSSAGGSTNATQVITSSPTGSWVYCMQPLKVGNATATILGGITDPDLHQIFFNANGTATQGAIDFTGSNVLAYVYPEWWGASTTATAAVNTPALQAAVWASFGNGPTPARTNGSSLNVYNRPLYLNGNYQINGELQFYDVISFKVVCASRLSSGITQTATNLRIIDGQSIAYGSFSDCGWTGSASSTGPLIDLDYNNVITKGDLSPQFIDFPHNLFNGNNQTAVGVQIAKSGGGAQGSNVYCYDCNGLGFTTAVWQVGTPTTLAQNALAIGWYGGDMQSCPQYGFANYGGGYIFIDGTTFECGFASQIGYDVFSFAPQGPTIIRGVRSESRKLWSVSNLDVSDSGNANQAAHWAPGTSAPLGTIYTGNQVTGDGAYYQVTTDSGGFLGAGTVAAPILASSGTTTSVTDTNQTIAGANTIKLFTVGETITQAVTGSTATVLIKPANLATVTGTNGGTPITPGETFTQGVTGVTATQVTPTPGVSSSNPLFLTNLSGTADNTHVWTGGTSGAVYTPNAAPTFAASSMLVTASTGAPDNSHNWTGGTSSAVFVPTAVPTNTAGWTVNAFTGMLVGFLSGTSQNCYGVITSNTATSITFSAGLVTKYPLTACPAPDNTTGLMVEANWNHGTVSSGGMVLQYMNETVIDGANSGTGVTQGRIQDVGVSGGQVAIWPNPRGNVIVSNLGVSRPDWWCCSAGGTPQIAGQNYHKWDVHVLLPGGLGAINWTYPTTGAAQQFTGAIQEDFGNRVITWMSGTVGSSTNLSALPVWIGGRSDPTSANDPTRAVLEYGGMLGRAAAFGTDQAGTDSDITGGASTGAGNGGGINFWTSNPSGSSATPNSGLKRWLIASAGHFFAGLDNTYDVGAAAANRPRRVYTGTDFVGPIGATTPAAGTFTTATAASVQITGGTTPATGFASLGTTTVGALPAAAAGNVGQMIKVSDSTAVAAEGQTCVGGSTNTALAFSNGTVWKCF